MDRSRTVQGKNNLSRHRVPGKLVISLKRKINHRPTRKSVSDNYW